MENPHSLTITPEGGRSTTLTLTHIGEAADWAVDGKIIRMLNGSPSPDSTWFHCVIVKDRIRDDSATLSDGEWANIVVAAIRTSEWMSARWLEIQLGGHNVSVSSEGVLMQFVVKAKPEMKGGSLIKRYEIKMPHTGFI